MRNVENKIFPFLSLSKKMTYAEYAKSFQATYGKIGSIVHLDILLSEGKINNRELKAIHKILSDTNQIISQSLKIKDTDFKRRIIGWAKREMLEKIEKKTFEDSEVKTTLENVTITLFKIALKNNTCGNV